MRSEEHVFNPSIYHFPNEDDEDEDWLPSGGLNGEDRNSEDASDGDDSTENSVVHDDGGEDIAMAKHQLVIA